ncbi:MAG: hypothetical protein AB1522_11960 [Chloroflexota bacterium]
MPVYYTKGIPILLVILIFFWLPKSELSSLVLPVLLLPILGITINGFLNRFVIPKFVNQIQEYSLNWQWFAFGLSFLAGLWLTLNIPLMTPPVYRTPFLPPLFVRVVYRLTSGAALGVFIFLVSIWVASKKIKPSSEDQMANKFSFVKYFLLFIMVWGLYLLAFFPAMMSADSFNQWRQILTGVYIDHHPPFHSFTIWLATRVAFTPTSVAVFQVLFLGFVAAQWFSFFENIRLPRWVIWVAAALFALTPVNGTMVNTLWKDVPFSTSVLALSLFLAKIVFTDGQWIHNWKAKILLGVVCALVLLFRHDGLPLGVGSLAALFVFYPRMWKNWIIALAICFGLYFGVRGPLYQAVGVQKSTVLAESSLSLYTMAAYAKPNSESENLIQSFSLLAPNWDCQIRDKISSEWRSTDLDYSISPIELTNNLLQRMPRVLIYFYRCARSMEWIVWDPYGEVRNASHVEVLVDPNPYGIQHDSKIPWLRDIIRGWVIKTSHDPSLNWFTWRPAFFLYINLFVSFVLILRYRSIKFGLISLPILIQSMTFSLIFAEPNFRYHYAVYLVSLVSLPFLFSTSLPKDDGTIL